MDNKGFLNDFTEEEEPICPLCRKVLVPDQGKTSGLYITLTKGLVLAHHECVKGK